MRKARIQEILSQTLRPVYLDVTDESDQHGGARNESHFKVHVISEEFRGIKRIDRQRRVQDLLGDEFHQGLHALSLRCETPEEAAMGGEFKSPDCAHRDSRDD